MNSAKVRDYLGIFGNIGLILGLLLVGFQIKQTNDLAKAQFLSDGFAQAMAIDFAHVGEKGPEVLTKVDVSPSDLSDEEILVLERLFRLKVSEQMRLEGLRKLGLSDTTIQFRASEFAAEIDSLFGRMYWDASKEYLNFSSEFIESVDTYLSEFNETKLDYYRRELERHEAMADDA